MAGNVNLAADFSNQNIMSFTWWKVPILNWIRTSRRLEGDVPSEWRKPEMRLSWDHRFFWSQRESGDVRRR